MQKPRILSISKRLEPAPAESDSDNVTKPRTSAYGRSSKTLKSLAKSSSNYIQIRKPLNVYMIEELSKLGRKTYFQRVHILARNIEEEQLKENVRKLSSISSDQQQWDFREYFQHHIEKIFATCEQKKCTLDNFSGLFIVMGCAHSYLMIEGAEDMIANFFEELVLVHDTFWTSSRVLLVEDKIGKILFSCFYSYRSPAININENFPLSTPKDYKQMVVQHFKLKENVQKLVETLSLELKNSSTLSPIEISVNSSKPFHLPANPYNKLLPEVQRIELALKANRFYRTVNDFSQTYRILQFHQDEDASIWPIPNNYTPLDIFQRSQFDVNLTFGNYGQEESTRNRDDE